MDLQLNRNKTKIMIIRKKHTRGRHTPPDFPTPLKQFDSLKILGVTLQCDHEFFRSRSIIFWFESNRIIYSINLLRHSWCTNSSVLQDRFSELESCLRKFCMHPPLGGDIYLWRTELESTLFWTNLKNSTCTLLMVHLSMICVALLMIDYSIRIVFETIIMLFITFCLLKRPMNTTSELVTHNFNLPVKTNDKNFFARVLYKNVY